MKCCVEPCTRDSYLTGYCSAHYQQIGMYGFIKDPIASPYRKRRVLRKLKTEGLCILSDQGCEDPKYVKGYCKRHHTQMYVHGRITSVPRILDRRKK